MLNTASTELDAINTMLSVIGEAPVNSLQGQLPTDVSMAQNTLEEVVREIQLEGWHFNSEDNYPLLVSEDGYIWLTPVIFRVTLADPDGRDVVVRGGKLYDRSAHSFIFDSDFEATIHQLLTYDEMPEAFRWYATVRAARKFQDRAVGSGELHGFTQEDEFQARMLAEREDTAVARPSMAKGKATTFISGWTVDQTLQR